MKRILAAALAVSLSGCAVGLLTKNESYTSSESVTLHRQASNFIPRASAVGRSLGYKVSGSFPDRNAVSLSQANSMIGTSLIGKIKQTDVTLTLQPDARTIRVDYTLMGNMSSAGEDKANGRIGQLKTALSAEFDR